MSTKTELIEQAAAAAGVSKAAAAKVLDSVLAGIAAAAAEGKEVRLHGFGTFIGKRRKARVCRNPKTGEDVQVPAKQTVKFRPSAKLAGAEAEERS